MIIKVSEIFFGNFVLQFMIEDFDSESRLLFATWSYWVSSLPQGHFD